MFAQVHTMQYPYGALKATFDNNTIISEVVPAIYGASLVTPTGKQRRIISADGHPMYTVGLQG